MSGKAIDYSTTPVSFYKFVCDDVEIKSSYVGHTTNFIKRKSDHRYRYNDKKSKDNKLYTTIRENGGWDNWKMVEIENRIVKDKREAQRIEQEYMEQLQTSLNMIRSTEYFLMSNRRINMKIRDTIVRKFPIEEAILKLDEIKQPYKLEKDYDVDII